MTKCIKCIRDLFEYVLYKFTLLVYLLSGVILCSWSEDVGSMLRCRVLTRIQKTTLQLQLSQSNLFGLLKEFFCY